MHLSSDMHDMNGLWYLGKEPARQNSSPVRESMRTSALERKRECVGAIPQRYVCSYLPLLFAVCPCQVVQPCTPVTLSVDQTNAREEGIRVLLTLSAAALMLPSSRPPPSPRAERRLTGQCPLGPSPCNRCCSWGQSVGPLELLW